MSTVSPTSIRAPERTAVSLVRSIAIAGPVIGILVGADMLIFYHLTQNVPPVLALQYFASGLLGPAAFAGGYTSAFLGVLIHFAISFVVAAVFILAARWIALVRRTVFASALVYGAAVNLFMSAIVLPPQRRTEAASYLSYCRPRSHRGRGVRWAASRHHCLAKCPREQSHRDRVGEGIVPENSKWRGACGVASLSHLSSIDRSE